MSDFQIEDVFLWDQAAPIWAKFQNSGLDIFRRRIVDRLCALASTSSGSLILDVGCGAGHISRELASKGARVLGIDISPCMIELALAASTNQEDAKFVCGDAAEMSRLLDMRFDTAICVFSLMSIKTGDEVFTEWHRLCSLDAKFYVYVFFPGLFGEAYRPCSPANSREYFSLNCQAFQSTIRWAVKGMPHPIHTNTYFRPLSHYIDMASKAGFDVHSLSAWDNAGATCPVEPALEPRVVEMVFTKKSLETGSVSREAGSVFIS